MVRNTQDKKDKGCLIGLLSPKKTIPPQKEELGKLLSEWREGDTYCTSPEILSRLLQSDQHYGFGQADR